MSINRGGVAPILAQKHYTTLGIYAETRCAGAPAEAIAGRNIPAICVLDPDGDLVRRLLTGGQARIEPAWACYHTQLYTFTHAGIDFGIVGCAVGASFAVLIAEEMFASGCKLLISVTSSGQIVPIRPPPYFIIRTLRDEALAITTSHRPNTAMPTPR
jgi:uridine phosphorylase